jgi:hypothetical protein
MNNKIHKDPSHQKLNDPKYRPVAHSVIKTQLKLLVSE